MARVSGAMRWKSSLETMSRIDRTLAGLTLFVDDPRIPMDNDYGERLIRNPAVGRRTTMAADRNGRVASR